MNYGIYIYHSKQENIMYFENIVAMYFEFIWIKYEQLKLIENL